MREDFIVSAKIGLPVASRRLVDRRRLLSRSDPLPPVTVICAPAGFGKSTLALQLIDSRRHSTAWYSLDASDSDARSFVAHLIAAVQVPVPGFGGVQLEQILSREGGAEERHMVRLVNALGELKAPLVLVLDDFHEISGDSVHALVGFLLEHQPAQVSVVITSRAEIQVPLGRLRAQGRVAEIGEQDLRLEDAEADSFVRESLGLELGGELTTELNRRTEGWVAGLQLACLSLRGVGDAGRFVSEFDSRDRFVTDYLTEEVLNRQSEEVRHFLLATSVLQRMNAPLAEAVSGVPDTGALLRRLEKQSMFLVALDHRREWYRYHHLFSGLLRHQLALRAGDPIRLCHAKASDWYAAHGFAREAFEHALSAEDRARAGRVLERHGWPMIATMQSREVSSWADRVGEPDLRVNLERLTIALVAAFIIGEEVDAARLAAAESLASAAGAPRDRADAIAWIRGGLLGRERRYREGAEVLARANTDTAAGTPFLSALPGYCRALAAYWQRDLPAAQRWLERSMNVSLEQGIGAGYFPAVLNLIDIARLRGDEQAAQAFLQRALKEAAERGWGDSVGMGWMEFARGEAYYAADELAAAEAAYARAVELTEYAGSNTLPLLARMRLAMIAHLRGDPTGALARARDIAQAKHRPNASFVCGIYDSMLPHMWLVLQQPDEAKRVLDRHGVAPDADPEPAREGEYLELARWCVGRLRTREIAATLARLLAAAEAGGRRRSVVESLALQALARQSEGDLKQATTLLENALTLGLALGDRRLFLDAGPGFAGLLRRVLEEDRLPPQARAFAQALAADSPTPPGGRAPEEEAAGEPLSRKELNALRLLAAGHSNEQIAAKMFVSANTVKTHLRHIYAKLGVSSRAAAIARATALRLLES